MELPLAAKRCADPGRTGPAYELTEADVEPPSALQCEATVEDASGSKVVTMEMK